MIEVGDLSQFGFRIGPVTPDRQMRDVSIFINDQDLTSRDPSVYLLSFIQHLTKASEHLKSKIDYLKHERLFRGLNITGIHNLLLHGSADVFRNEQEWWAVVESLRFADWGETTAIFAAFLIPYYDRLYLTWQAQEEDANGYKVLDVIESVETTPYYLITTMDKAVTLLSSSL